MSTATATSSAIPATPAKLRDGSWGARIEGAAAPGDTLTITTKAGKTWQAKVTRVVWQGEGVALVATVSLDSAPRAAAPAAKRRKTGWEGIRGGRCRECGGPIKDCSHHRAMGGLCGSCAFDEYDC